jgi:murein DD-endopeptidase MepM/ murein hydrolase activator NlpD
MMAARISRSILILALAAACCALPLGALAQKTAVTLTPEVVETGSPVLIRVSAPRRAVLDGEWLGRKIEFFRGRGGSDWFALAGIDVEAATGASTLTITARMPDGRSLDLSRAVDIQPANYRTTALTVAPEFVEPDPEELKRIHDEETLKKKIFAVSTDHPLWSGNFRAPVHAPPTDSFGTRRVFNGKLDSTHKGMDFRAQTGTPVTAGNSGVVVLARPLFYEGNCVAIDHGLGLFTISMHLSRIDVSEGERVSRGQRIGLSGATGRATGPHLHWGVRWQGAYLDPAKLLRLDLASAHD